MNTTDLPIIVGGCHRSGTSLLRRILNAHSRIYCAPEIKFFRDFYNAYYYDPLKHDRFMTTAHTMLPEEDLLDVLGHAFITMHERAAAQSGKQRWADKNPENVLYLSTWEQLLGDQWLFIHAVRNPLDTIASMREARYDDVIPRPVDARIDHYQRFHTAGLEFAARHPEHCRRVIYEDLVSEPEKVLVELMGWLGEKFEPGQLEFNKASQQRGVEDFKVRETTGIHFQSIGRWSSMLTAEEAARIAEKCDALWRELDPEGKYAMPSRRELQEAHLGPAANRLAQQESPEVPEIFSQAKSDFNQRYLALERWSQELVEQIAIRDRELARFRNFLPIRAARDLRSLLRRLGE